MKHSRGGGGNFLTGFIIALIMLMAALIIYIVNWYAERARIEMDSARYRTMYSAAPMAAGASASPEPTEALQSPQGTEAAATPTPEETTSAPSDTPTASATARRTPSPTPSPSQTPTDSPAPTEKAAQATATASMRAVSPSPDPAPTEAPATQTPSPAPTATETPTPAPTATPKPTDTPEPTDTPLPTPDADTLLLTMPTQPPIQASFATLLAANPDTVGYLAMGDSLSLPVVQRENDNEFYLDHGFEQQKAREGALFLDGVNRLVPEDDCLIVYGHNMKNGTMFGQLSAMGKASGFKKHAVVRFDTLYANHLYVPFASFYASMKKDSASYFEVRRFLMQPEEFEVFVEELKNRSRVDVPVDVAYGDSLLLLVTCDYHGDDSRFILALRRLREGESEEDVQAMVEKAK